MLSISLGPLALPLLPLLWLGAVGLASWGAERWMRQTRHTPEQAQRAGHAVMVAALVGWLGARAGHVLQHLDVFVTSPWSVLDVRDGGGEWGSGLAAGLAWLALRLWREPTWRRPVLGATALSASLAVVGGVWLGVGQAPPPVVLTLTPLDASSPHPLRLGEATGRPRIVNLWASWCGPCRAEMPLLARTQHLETGLDVLFVNQGESAAAVRAYLTDTSLALRHVWLDDARALGRAVGSTGLPTTLFYDAQGRLVSRHFGILTAVALETKLRALRPSPSPFSPLSAP